MPSTPLRRQLRAHGHALRPVILVGKNGLTGALRRELQQAAFAHELVKVKLASECPLDRFEVAARLAEETGIRIVQILGRIILVYKRHPQEPKFEGKRGETGAAEASPKPTRTRRRARNKVRRPRSRSAEGPSARRHSAAGPGTKPATKSATKSATRSATKSATRSA